MTEKNFIVPASEFNTQIAGSVNAKSPSNIALVKYWGKTSPQIPTNPSISYTLTQSFTETQLNFAPKKAEFSNISVRLNGEEQPNFVPKIQQFFDRIHAYAPYLQDFDFEIITSNSFPHSSGIASSASGMSALAKCLLLLEEKMLFFVENPLQRASFMARLGSGSACRSLYPGLVAWGKSSFLPQSSDLFAVPVDTKIHPIFTQFEDTILLIHEGSKSVSSTVGHQLMNGHPYAAKRFDEAKQNIGKLLEILQNGDLESFGNLCEHEALSLHAVMLMSKPPYILMMPNTIAVINKIWEFRKETNLPLFFTLDAGANIHLLYPTNEKEKIRDYIEKELLTYCQNGKAIYDFVNFENL
ncbi:MAG: diphosphomevalonate decarboxylase [Flavobacteriaceae bacterium]|nr:diphosphomevalonate decarboxylase [Flavobacteriaceae bacterium]